MLKRNRMAPLLEWGKINYKVHLLSFRFFLYTNPKYIKAAINKTIIAMMSKDIIRSGKL